MNFKIDHLRGLWYIRIKGFLCTTIVFWIIHAVIYYRYELTTDMFFICAESALLCLLMRMGYRREFECGDYEPVYDRYARRLFNWAFYVMWRFPMTVLDYFYLMNNSRAQELPFFRWLDLSMWLIPGVFIVTKLLVLREINKKYLPDRYLKLKRSVKKAVIVSAVYWTAACAVWYAFDRVFVLDSAALLSGIYLAGVLAFNVKGMDSFLYARSRHSKAFIAVVLIPAVIVGSYNYMSRDFWLTQPYINSTPNIYAGNAEISYDDKSGVFTLTKTDDDFRILQLTDIHIGGSVLSFDKDDKALRAVFKLLEYTRPDLVIVTGDLSYPLGISSFSFNNTASVQQFAAFMRNTGIPWAFTYGNHDTEVMAATSSYSLGELYKSLSWKTSRNLMYPYVQPDISGRNNQLIELRNVDGSLNQALFLIDSNAYIGKRFDRYDYIHDDQTVWYEENVKRLCYEEGRTVSSMAFIHIPLQEYRTAYDLYTGGNDSVIYYYGMNSEGISCSQYSGSFFETAVRLNSTKAIFCGHDHYNNASIEYKGIRLTYGMSIDFLVEPGIARDTAQRGATLITVHDDSTFDIEPVPLDSITYQE